MAESKFPIPAQLAYLITFGFFAVLFAMMFAEVNATMKDPLLLMLGALISAFTGIVGYYFGTSASNAKKDQTITDLTKTASINAVTNQATAEAAAAGGPVKVNEMSVAAGTVNVDRT